MSIFIGGTGNANEFHDYEKGTWTPNLGNGGSRGITYAKYVKVGRMVFLNFELNSVQPSANNSQFIISNLPFTVNGTGHGFGNFAYVGASSVSAVNLMPIHGSNTSYIYFHRQDGTGNTWTNNQQRSTSWNQPFIIGSWYETDA